MGSEGVASTLTAEAGSQAWAQGQHEWSACVGLALGTDEVILIIRPIL